MKQQLFFELNFKGAYSSSDFSLTLQDRTLAVYRTAEEGIEALRLLVTELVQYLRLKKNFCFYQC